MLKAEFEARVEQGRAKLKEMDLIVEAIRHDMTEAAKLYFAAEFKKFFDENPEIVKVTWTQYTPSWNDGDTCTFRSDHDYPTIYALVDGEEEDIEDLKPYKKWHDNYFPKVTAILKFLTKKDIAMIFGESDQKVIITPSGVVLEEYYDHE